MYKTGDIQKNIEKLRIELHQIKYPDKLDSNIFTKGNPEIYLPIIHYTLFNYSSFVAKYLLDKKCDMYAKNDLDFINSAFQSLIRFFNYKPTLSTKQFFTDGFAEGKVILCSNIINIVKAKHSELAKKSYASGINLNIKNKTKKGNNNISPNQKVKATPMPMPQPQQNIKMDKKQSNYYIGGDEHEENDEDTYNNVQKLGTPPSPKFNNGINNFSNENNDITNNTNYLHLDDDSNHNMNNLSKEMPKDSHYIRNYNNIYNDEQFEQNLEQRSDIHQNKEQIEIFDSSQDFPLGGKSVFDVNNNTNTSITNENINLPESNESFGPNQKKQINYPKQMPNNYNPNTNNNDVNFNSLVQVINSLSGSVTQMASKIEKFKLNMEDRMNKVEAEIALIKNRLNIIEAKQNNPSEIHEASLSNNVNVNPNLNAHVIKNLIDSNENIFSFARKDSNKDISTPNIINNQINNSINSTNSINKDDKDQIFYNNIYNFESTNNPALNNNNNNYYYTNNNMNTFLQNPMTHQTNNMNFGNSTSKYNETDQLIENVEKKFRETQQLLSQLQ